MLDNRNFLLPDATFAIEMVAFAAVLVVMTRYVVPHIRECMRERQRVIDEALVGARDADRRRRDADAAADAIRAEARREAQLIIEQARSMRDHLIAEGRTTGVEEYRWLAGRADRELQRRTALARDQLRRQPEQRPSRRSASTSGRTRTSPGSPRWSTRNSTRSSPANPRSPVAASSPREPTLAGGVRRRRAARRGRHPGSPDRIRSARGGAARTGGLYRRLVENRCRSLRSRAGLDRYLRDFAPTVGGGVELVRWWRRATARGR